MASLSTAKPFLCAASTFRSLTLLSNLMKKNTDVRRDPKEFSRAEIDRVIMMAWEDRTSFDAIQTQFSLSHGDVIRLMRQEMKPRSFRMWRKRTAGRATKHEATFSSQHGENRCRRFRAKSQRG
ncbi:hypothetical protein RBSH_03969 [Rhodopirellula baltica SH28]|uniref:TIGR03643 family protein n=3 Tax=Rhodopirellula baltica TaxID=265606 RepID=K5E4U0_RHOBT|nr:hypothetical protein RBSH_03969 [Rhodopirellula baltica SH28]